MGVNEIEKAIEIGRKYTKRSEMEKKDFHYYYILKNNNLLDNIIPLQHPILTYDICYNEAKRYKDYTDFRINANKYYCKAIRKGWLKDYTWLRKGFYDMKARVHIVYVYEIPKLKYAYVGRTMRPSIRKMQHKKDFNDSVYKFVNEHHLSSNDIIYKVLKNELTAEESQYYEKFYVDEYVDKSWELINKAKTGSLGGNITRWTYDICYNEALKYETETSFRQNSLHAYEKAHKMGWKRDYYWLEKYDPHIYYTYDDCYQTALQCKNRTDFIKKFPSKYRYSKLNGFIDDFKWLISKVSNDNIIEYDLNGNFVFEHKNSEFKGAKRQSVLGCANGRLQSGYKRIWKYKCDVLDKDGNIILKINGIKENGIPIVQYDSNGKYIQEFKSINEAAKSINCSSSSIFDALQGKKTILCYGYAWRYKKDILDSNGEIIKEVKLRKNNRKRRLVQYDEDGNLVNVYDSATIAYKEHTRHKVEWTLKDNWKRGKYGRSKLFFGYVWFYESEVLDERGEVKNKIDLD